VHHKVREDIVDSILGCIIGGAIGDAAGAAFEGGTAVSAPPLLSGEHWYLTDDTQLTLATCEAVVERGFPDPACIADSFLRWFRARRVTGLGASTLKALRDLEVGAHWALAGRQGEMAAGNGAATRVAPLAFCLDPLLDESRRLIRDVCRITHHSDEAYIGGFAVVLAVRATSTDGIALEAIASHLPDTTVRDRLLCYGSLASKLSIAVAAERFGASGFVAESVPLSLFAAGKVAHLGFSEMLEQLIAVGGDTDSNASIAGQVAGAALGYSGLPPALLNKLPQADFVFGIARAFAEHVFSHIEQAAAFSQLPHG
jgi:ADP-ribosylglycohydrolase